MAQSCLWSEIRNWAEEKGAYRGFTERQICDPVTNRFTSANGENNLRTDGIAAYEAFEAGESLVADPGSQYPRQNSPLVWRYPEEEMDHL